jgi:predicted SAM-dependent methyltransferase
LPLLTRTQSIARSLIRTGPVPLRVIREVRTETHLAAVRLRRLASPNMRSVERSLIQKTNIKLHFGCGPRILPDWVNVDGWPFPGIDLAADLRRPLPLGSGSCCLIFTEHVFEHIDIDFRIPVLREFFRILQPGGTLRIVVPDCKKFAAAYIRGDTEWFKTGLGWPDGAEGLNRVFTMHTHRFIDDWTSLSTSLQRVGFCHVELSSFNASAIPELRIDSDAPSRIQCSLYVEARR